MIHSLQDFKPRLPKGKNFWIAETANVIGNVTINRMVSVWYGAVLRGDNEPIFIGEGSNVQENCVLHTDFGYPLTIGSNCTIGHSAVLHGCKIENACLIGMGAIILNGALIRENSLVGAGALVTEGKEFPENSLIIGNPAKVVRQLTKEESKSIYDSAIGYQKNSEKFKKYCKRILV